IENIEKLKPKLVFLDIEMPFNNGFVLLEKIKDPAFEVIFTTAYNNYALQAIKASALDYLLKPIDVDELKFAVSKIGNRTTVVKTNTDFETLLSNLKIKSTHAKIAIPTFEGLQMISVNNIVKCTADESYTHITLTNNTKITVSRILKEYDDMLSDMNFFRVHNSCLINLTHVNKYIKGDGGYVIMSDGSSVEVSRRKKTDLLTRLSRVQM
ncbi:MAG: LytTR family DNA-binding domain-containing protein, partial [Bacteroidia bacterium]